MNRELARSESPDSPLIRPVNLGENRMGDMLAVAAGDRDVLSHVETGRMEGIRSDVEKVGENVSEASGIVLVQMARELNVLRW